MATQIYRKKTIKAAQALLAHPGATGDHGFTGKQLTAWKKMRDGWTSSLRKVVRNERLTKKELEAEYTCPLDAIPDAVWVAGFNPGDGHPPHMNCVEFPGKAVKNPKHTKGTRSGRDWSIRLRNFMDEIYYELKSYDQLANNIDVAEKELAQAKAELADFLK